MFHFWFSSMYIPRYLIVATRFNEIQLDVIFGLIYQINILIRQLCELTVK
jgi:hypothetical protein